MKRALFLLLPMIIWSQNPAEDPILKLFHKAQDLHYSKDIDFEIYNPFALPVAPKRVKAPTAMIADQPLPLLGGIVNQQAFLNRRWYRVGQKVGIYMIVSISPHEVVLANGGKLYKLRVSLGEKRVNLRITKP